MWRAALGGQERPGWSTITDDILGELRNKTEFEVPQWTISDPTGNYITAASINSQQTWKMREVLPLQGQALCKSWSKTLTLSEHQAWTGRFKKRL